MAKRGNKHVGSGTTTAYLDNVGLDARGDGQHGRLVVVVGRRKGLAKEPSLDRGQWQIAARYLLVWRNNGRCTTTTTESRRGRHKLSQLRHCH